ncbi:MAG: preprotein translocase subunit SecE [Moraxella sp.]|nr:preprotein translocase subunit SecE [Moraxella sp.]
MSDNKDTLEKKLADAKAMAGDMLQKRQNPVVVSKESVVEVAKQRSAKDIVLWLVAVFCLISATLAPDYLTAVWAPANNTWVRLGMTVGLVIVALLCLAFTNQGGAFKTLLKDASIELRRITWPSKNETTTYTWQVIVVTIIAGIIVWLLDNFFNYVVGFILGS